MAFVPVIILDLRVPTAPLAAEAEIAARRYLAKSLFLRAGDGADVIAALPARLRPRRPTTEPGS